LALHMEALRFPLHYQTKRVSPLQKDSPFINRLSQRQKKQKALTPLLSFWFHYLTAADQAGNAHSLLGDGHLGAAGHADIGLFGLSGGSLLCRLPGCLFRSPFPCWHDSPPFSLGF
jgi:hypothetical protein